MVGGLAAVVSLTRGLQRGDPWKQTCESAAVDGWVNAAKALTVHVTTAQLSRVAVVGAGIAVIAAIEGAPIGCQYACRGISGVEAARGTMQVAVGLGAGKASWAIGAAVGVCIGTMTGLGPCAVSIGKYVGAFAGSLAVSAIASWICNKYVLDNAFGPCDQDFVVTVCHRAVSYLLQHYHVTKSEVAQLQLELSKEDFYHDLIAHREAAYEIAYAKAVNFVKNTCID